MIQGCVTCNQELTFCKCGSAEAAPSISPEERAKDMVWHFAEGGLRRDQLTDVIAQAIREAIAAEREACAKVADEIATDANMVGWQTGCRDVANAIRARK